MSSIPRDAADHEATLPLDDVGRPGDVFGDYRVVRRLGGGSFGAVHLAEDLRDGGRVALKVLHRGAASSAEAVRRFRREAEIARDVDHPGICRIFASGVAEGRPYLAMRFVPGRSLADVIAAAGEPPRDVRAAAALFARAARALEAAHRAGVLHRDLKPANIVLDEDGAPVLVDFGLARALRGDGAQTVGAETAVGVAVGSPAYMAPEQAGDRSEPVDERSDVWSLGVCLYEYLALRRPFDGPTILAVRAAAARAEPADPRRANEAVDAGLAAVISTALEKEPARRYASAAAFADDLERVARGDRPATAPPGPLRRVARFARAEPRIAAAFAAAIAALAVVVALLARLRGAYDDVAAADEEKRGALARRGEALADYERLADAKKLDDLLVEADRLWPATPETVAALDAWVARATALVARRPEHEAAVARLAIAVPEADSDPGIAFRRATETAFLSALRAAESEGPPRGAIADVRRRLAFARRVARATVEEPAAAWRAAAEAISADPRFAGFRLAPQLGLIPLGADPRSGLQEFLHLATHDPDAATPTRDAAGALPLDARTGCVLVLLPGGEFVMGSDPENDPEADRPDRWSAPDERPAHAIRLAPFFMAKHETTQAVWMRAVGENPSLYNANVTAGERAATPLHPVERVSWIEADEALRRAGLRLPTEAQWEYAARAGTETPWWCGDRPASLAGNANLSDATCRLAGGPPNWEYDDFEDGFVGHAPIGSFAPNPFGLHDMIGNVWEWTADWRAPYGGAVRDRDGLRAASVEVTKVFRGGGYNTPAIRSRCADRPSDAPSFRTDFLGVRAARLVDP